jgi:exo-1,4-beta-D-glucosaminidase
MVGSDKCPKPELEINYANLIKSIDNRPYLVSAGTRVSTVSGPSGVKMNGPYEYVTPNYWYTDTINGGAFGFNTETGPGPQVPVLESLKKMIPADKLWPPNEIWNYHCTHSKQAFNTMDVFNAALEARYGKAANLDDYLLKSDAQSFEAMKGMFEAFRVNIPKTTGIIQWMLNSAWPSMYWHLYDYYLRPSAAYYAARIANQPVQLIYNYRDNSIYAVNETRQEVKNLKAEIRLLNTDSKVLTNKDLIVNIPSNSSIKILQLDPLTGNEFLSMKLADSNGQRVAGNFYWLSEKPDELAWDKTNWVFTPLKSFADFTPLSELQTSEIMMSCKTEMNGSNLIIHTRISNPTDKVAFFISLTLNDDKGVSICPALWDDNYISLLPGEIREISCTVPRNTVAKNNTQLLVSGWNIKPQTIGIK